MARKDAPAYMIIAEIVCSAILLGLNLSFLGALPMQFGSGFQPLPMVLAEGVGILSVGLIVNVALFVFAPSWTRATQQRVLWTYLFAGIWFRILALSSVVALASLTLSWQMRRSMGGEMLPGPVMWGIFTSFLAIAAYSRARRVEKYELFAANDQRIRAQEKWFKSRFVNAVPVQKKQMGLRDMPSTILLLFTVCGIGLGCLVLGIAAAGAGELFSLAPLLLGGALTIFPLYWLALLASQLRDKPLTIVAMLERDAATATAGRRDVLSGQRTVLLTMGLFSIVPLAITSAKAAWFGFAFAIACGLLGFIALQIMQDRLVQRQRVTPMDAMEFERCRMRLTRRGCDYGLGLLIVGLLIITLTPGVVAWGTGEEPIAGIWGRLAFIAWAWLMLAALSSWLERATKPLWAGQPEGSSSIRIAEILTWPFQLFFFLNPWEVFVRLRSKLAHP